INRHTWANTFKGGGGGLSRNGCVCFNITPIATDYLLKLARVKYQADTRPDGRPLISGFIGASSPLRFDGSIMECMLKLAKEKQVVAIGSNVLGGAQAPVTLASVVAMENAERLGGLSLLMAADPDAFVYFVNHPSFMDMTCGNVANGSPEHSLMAMCATGLLRYYGLQLMANHPVISTGEQVPGNQAAVEKALHAMLSGLSGTSGVCGCGSLMDSMSYEQLVIDNEVAGMVKHYLKGLDVNDETIALDVIEEMGIGGAFLEHPSVARNVRSVYWQPKLWNRLCYSEWFREGAKDVLEKAHERVAHILATHHPKPLTQDQEDQMDEILKEAEAVLVAR
ncbi:MAG: trimethylamine methyltransferase family protein, partial [Armatimonadetes bacterium]|nr:trimethylamine methyltransferase family protein [Armatimonadota bacterium]